MDISCIFFLGLSYHPCYFSFPSALWRNAIIICFRFCVSLFISLSVPSHSSSVWLIIILECAVIPQWLKNGMNFTMNTICINVFISLKQWFVNVITQFMWPSTFTFIITIICHHCHHRDHEASPPPTWGKPLPSRKASSELPWAECGEYPGRLNIIVVWRCRGVIGADVNCRLLWGYIFFTLVFGLYCLLQGIFTPT